MTSTEPFDSNSPFGSTNSRRDHHTTTGMYRDDDADEVDASPTAENTLALQQQQQHQQMIADEMLFFHGIIKPVTTFVRVGNVVDNIFSYLPKQTVPKMRLVSSFWNFVALGATGMVEQRAPLLLVANNMKDDVKEDAKNMNLTVPIITLFSLACVGIMFFGFIEDLERLYGQIAYGVTLSLGGLLCFILSILVILPMSSVRSEHDRAMPLIIGACIFVTVVFGSVGFHYLGQFNQFADAASREVWEPECDPKLWSGGEVYPATVRFYDPQGWQQVGSRTMYVDENYMHTIHVYFAVYTKGHYPAECGFGYRAINPSNPLRANFIYNITQGTDMTTAGMKTFHTYFKRDEARKYRSMSPEPVIDSGIPSKTWEDEARKAERIFLAMFCIVAIVELIMLGVFVLVRSRSGPTGTHKLRGILGVLDTLEDVEAEEAEMMGLRY